MYCPLANLKPCKEAITSVGVALAPLLRLTYLGRVELHQGSFADGEQLHHLHYTATVSATHPDVSGICYQPRPGKSWRSV
jgi:hypothetical protein